MREQMVQREQSRSADRRWILPFQTERLKSTGESRMVTAVSWSNSRLDSHKRNRAFGKVNSGNQPVGRRGDPLNSTPPFPIISWLFACLSIPEIWL